MPTLFFHFYFFFKGKLPSILTPGSIAKPEIFPLSSPYCEIISVFKDITRMSLVLLAQLVPTLSFPLASVHLAFLDQLDFPQLAMRHSSAVHLLARRSDWPQQYPFNQHLFGTD